MTRHWLKSYRDGIPHDIDPEQLQSLNGLCESSFKKNASKPVSVCLDSGMFYARLDDLSLTLGAWDLSLAHPGPSFCPTYPSSPSPWRRSCGQGYTCVNVNPLHTDRKLEHQRRDAGASTLIILENFAASRAEVIERTPVKNVVSTSPEDLLGFWYGHWMTFAARHLVKLVPAYKLPLGKGCRVTAFAQAIPGRRSATPLACPCRALTYTSRMTKATSCRLGHPVKYASGARRS